ncbi:MAG TPA: outer membrane lipoprotein carrier protein LolA [Chitinophagaceae bacterium]|nr:outer membrane lipoprotein carrier protein LolA [Chitinophagaceae bacterium]
MKNIYLLVLFATVVGPLFAQKDGSNDPDAKKILDAVSAKFKSYKAVQASFTYKVENADGKAISTKKGTVYMKGTKYRVSFVGQEIFCDGNTVWTYDQSSNEVTITKLDVSTTTLTPQKLFTNFYDKDFLYKLNGETKVGGKTIQEIEMTPNDKSKPFHKVYLEIDKIAKTIYSTKVLEKEGNRYSYTVNALNGSANIPDTKFAFNKQDYPGVEEVDLR